MGRGFERGIEDIIGSGASAVTKAVTNTAKVTGAQVGLSNNSSFGNTEGVGIETNQHTTQQSPQSTQNPAALDPSNLQQQSLAEQQKLSHVRQQLQSQHMRTYFIPTFQEKPAKIKQEREQRWEQANQQKDQEKKQMEFMEEKKKEEATPWALNKHAKGEIGKVGSG